MRRALVLLALLAAARPAAAADHASWDEYMKANRFKCPGPFDTLKTARQLTLGGKTYKHTGYRLEVTSPDADHTMKLGVVSAIKDVSPSTKDNLEKTLAWFKAEKVEWLVVNGDLALEELDLEEVLSLLGASGLPTLVIIGNSESKGSFARVFKDVAAKYPQLINGVLVRQLVLDDAELWTLPGYHDKRFVHQGAGCIYATQDVDDLLKTVKPAGVGPVVLVAHGPPRGNGKDALDWIADKQNVGDPDMARLIEKASIPFGLFGHILEAGNNTVGKDLATKVPAGKLLPALYLNAGSLSGDPWTMNDGTGSRGMAFIVTIEGDKAKYEARHLTPPAEE